MCTRMYIYIYMYICTYIENIDICIYLLLLLYMVHPQSLSQEYRKHNIRFKP